MLFDERTMQYFQIIAQERNISRAAQKLYISQPSLSRFLSKLEAQVGGELFERRKNLLTLTPVGESFLEYIREAQRLNAYYQQKFSAVLHQEKKLLRIGAGSTTSPYLTQETFPAFQREYPNIQLQLVEELHTSLLLRLERKQVDLSMLVCTDEEREALKGPETDVIIQQPRLLAVSRQHPLAALIRDPAQNTVFPPNPSSRNCCATRP